MISNLNLSEESDALGHESTLTTLLATTMDLNCICKAILSFSIAKTRIIIASISQGYFESLMRQRIQSSRTIVAMVNV